MFDAKVSEAGGDALTPVPPEDRVATLDILRGFAMFGVLWSNLNDGYGTLAAATPLDRSLWWIQRWLVDGRFYSLLGFLFGIGFAIQLQRTPTGDLDRRNIFLRRMLVLLGIGIFHGLFIWSGDILTNYALLGFLLLLYRGLSQKRLALATALTYLFLPYLFLRVFLRLKLLPGGGLLHGEPSDSARDGNFRKRGTVGSAEPRRTWTTAATDMDLSPSATRFGTPGGFPPNLALFGESRELESTRAWPIFRLEICMLVLEEHLGGYMRCFALALAVICPGFSQTQPVPKTIADSVAGPLKLVEWQLLGVAEAMPESKYSFIPTAGNFEDARSFGEQLKHVACAQFAFFNEMEGKTPPAECEKGGPSKAASKGELIQYLRDSFDYGNKVLAAMDQKNMLDRIEGRYAGPNSRLGMAVIAVWHMTDHFGQLVEYLRMNGIVPPVTQRYGQKIR